VCNETIALCRSILLGEFKPLTACVSVTKKAGDTFELGSDRFGQLREPIRCGHVAGYSR